jgi:hypothetical protein
MAAKDTRPVLESHPLKGAKGWYVQIDWPDGSFEQVGVFPSKSEATECIVINLPNGSRKMFIG